MPPRRKNVWNFRGKKEMFSSRWGNGGASSSPPSSPSGWGSVGCSSSGTSSSSPPSSLITPLLFRLLKFIFCREVSPTASLRNCEPFVFGLEGRVVLVLFKFAGTLVYLLGWNIWSFGIEIFDRQQEEEYWERRPAVDKNEVRVRNKDLLRWVPVTKIWRRNF